jgi:hypothetical protein
VIFARLSWLPIALALCACAASPPAPVASAVDPAVVKQAAVTPAPAATATGSAAAPTATDANRESVLKQARTQGYKAQRRDGQTVYCRKEGTIGTRFEKTVCLNEDELVQVSKERAATQQDAMNHSQTCSGMGCRAN